MMTSFRSPSAASPLCWAWHRRIIISRGVWTRSSPNRLMMACWCRPHLSSTLTNWSLSQRLSGTYLAHREEKGTGWSSILHAGSQDIQYAEDGTLCRKCEHTRVLSQFSSLGSFPRPPYVVLGGFRHMWLGDRRRGTSGQDSMYATRAVIEDTHVTRRPVQWEQLSAWISDT